jgi:hypothetical protein
MCPGHQYFDTISVYRANDESMQGFEQLGVPKNKVHHFKILYCKGQCSPQWSNIPGEGIVWTKLLTH